MRTYNNLVAMLIAFGLIGNAVFEYDGWTLAGTIFGYVLIVLTLWAVVDDKIKERDNL